MRVDETPFGSVGINAEGEVDFSPQRGNGQGAKMKNLVINAVRDDSVAHAKGLRVNDEIVKLDGHPITQLSAGDVERIWGGKEVGDIVRFEIVRGKGKETKTIGLPVQKKTKSKPPSANPAPDTKPAAPAPAPPAARP